MKALAFVCAVALAFMLSGCVTTEPESANVSGSSAHADVKTNAKPVAKVPRPTQLSVLISSKFETVHGLVRTVRGDHTPQQKGRRVKATFYARLMGVAT
ncbi:MAG: hypothetical protein WBQ20_14550, partial [Methyloceanibacter sp.]